MDHNSSVEQQKSAETRYSIESRLRKIFEPNFASDSKTRYRVKKATTRN